MALSISEQIKDTWWLLIGGALINFAFIALGWVKGPLKTWWTIGGVISILIGGWGFAMSSGMIPTSSFQADSGYTYYYDGNYYFA